MIIDDKNKYDKIYKWLSFTLAFGYDRIRLWDLLELFSDVDEAYEAVFSADAFKFYTQAEITKFKALSDNQIHEIICYCDKNNVGILCYSDDEYPERFRRISTPPAMLFYRGDISLLSEDYIIAVVGTRKASNYSLEVVSAISATLAKNDFVTVSGFAVGIDIQTHLSTVRNGGKTIVICANGIDYNYPQQNSVYVREIIENGLMISEYLPTVKPISPYFSSRNRLLAAISLGTVVIEAAQKSGSLSTASHAVTQGKDIWTIPPQNIFDGRYFGNVSLLRDGAMPVYSPKDILEEYLGGFTHKFTKGKLTDYLTIEPIIELEMPKETAKKPIYYDIKPVQGEKVKVAASKPEPLIKVMPDNLSENEQKIFECLNNSSKAFDADEISAVTGLSVADVMDTVMSLELSDIVISTLDMKYILK